jgi:hypothetical protein
MLWTRASYLSDNAQHSKPSLKPEDLFPKPVFTDNGSEGRVDTIAKLNKSVLFQIILQGQILTIFYKIMIFARNQIIGRVKIYFE